MMIHGLGMDIVEVEAIEAALGRDSDCASAWLTEREIGDLGNRSTVPKVLAGRVAAKEAVVKALGTGFAGEIAWQDVEVLAADGGAPTIQLSGGAAKFAQSQGVVRILITITHTGRVAAACAATLMLWPSV